MSVIYVYRCKKCGVKFDVAGSFTQLIGSSINCPECCSTQVQRVWNAPNIIYKAKGFYSTDRED